MIVIVLSDYYVSSIVADSCGGITGLRLLPDVSNISGQLLSVGNDDELLVWNISSTLTLSRSLTTGKHVRVISLLNKKSQKVATGSLGQLQVWNLAPSASTNPLLLTIPIDAQCLALDVLSDGVTLVVGTGWPHYNDQSQLIEETLDEMRPCVGTCTNIKLYNSTDGSLLKSLMGHTDSILSLKVFRDGGSGSDLLASGSRDRTIRIWNMTATSTSTSNGVLIRTMPTRYGACESLEVIPSGDESVLWLACGANTISVWNVNTGSLVKTLGTAYSSPVLALKLVGANLLAVGSHLSRVDFVDVRSSGWKALVQSIDGTGSSVMSLEMLPDGVSLASASANPDACANLLIFNTMTTSKLLFWLYIQ